MENKKTVHNMLIKPEYFELVKSGVKKYEVRTNDERRKAMKIGDQILLIKEPEKVETLLLDIVDKKEYPNFTTLYDSLPKRDVGFEGRETKDIVQELRRFYTEEQENQIGVVAIEVALAKEDVIEGPPKLLVKTNNKN